MSSYENMTWKYDIERYERCKNNVNKYEGKFSGSFIDYCKRVVNEVADKYPSAKLERV